MFKEYKNCIFCNNSKLKKEKDQKFNYNFYLKAVVSDLNLSYGQLKKIKIFRCTKCFNLQNNPWFKKEIARKIYSNIYGQHNRGWSNLLNFVKKNKKPNHGNLFNIIKNNINIKNYGEYNSPFMGLFINFFEEQFGPRKNFYKIFFRNTLEYLRSRQVAGCSQKVQDQSLLKATRYLKKINYLKTKTIKNKKINKYFFFDNSDLLWGQNDNFKSVNSKSLATELFDLKTIDINRDTKKIKLDLFGIFHTLDHTFEPNKVLKFALKNSKYVIVYCHIDKKLNKQHLFSFTNKFLNYLDKENIYSINITTKIGKKFKSPELYFICSQKKKDINNLKYAF